MNGDMTLGFLQTDSKPEAMQIIQWADFDV